MKKIDMIDVNLKFFISHVTKTAAFSWLVFISGMPGTQAALPVPHSSLPWSNNVRITEQTGNLIRIGQNQGRSGNWVLNWQNFDISAGNRVIFDQPSASHIALNRIYQNSPVQIDGAIDANGRVYLINQNGFVFGENSSINVNSLVASSLALNIGKDADFINNDKNIASIVNAGAAAFDIDAFKYKVTPDGRLLTVGENGVTLNSSELRKIEIKEGAIINAQDGGNILMFAPDIINNGDINTRSGQVILGATNDRVYLTPSTDPALRGFLVEVETGGSIDNLGKVLAQRGNITLAGMVINQTGILQATTSVNENGTIRLLARDGATEVTTVDSNLDELILGIDIDKAKAPDGSSLRRDNYIVSKNTGTVVLNSGSLTRVSVDRSDNTQVLDSQKVEKSRIEITANEIRLKNNSEIKLAGGDVILHATSDASLTAVDSSKNLRAKDTLSKIILEAGSRIDVSGTTDTVVDMQRNELAVTLTGNFLRDAPLQRDGVLRNELVTLDIRKGTPLGDISDLVEGRVKRGISERLSAGGNVQIISQGGVVAEDGSSVDISAGQVHYNEGYISSSQLLTATGETVDIADAAPDRPYINSFGHVTVNSERWGKAATREWGLFNTNVGGITRFYNAYTDASDGGNLNIQTHGAVLDNALLAGSGNGLLQREQLNQSSGGRLNIILSNPDLSADTNRAQSVSIVNKFQGSDRKGVDKNSEADLDAFLASSDSAPQWVLQLEDRLLTSSGISDFSLRTNGDIKVDAAASVNLSASGRLQLQGKRMQLDSDIRIVSGQVDISSFNDLQINQTIDVSGNWVNDDPYIAGGDLNQQVNLNGGAISLDVEKGDLLLSSSRLLANGGAWLQADGTLKAGNGGAISLAVKDINGQAADLQLGEMQAYALVNGNDRARGGQLSITANKINIASQFSTAALKGELQLTTDFFESSGFSDYSLISNTDNLTLLDETVLRPDTQSLQLNAGFNRESGADSILGVSSIKNLPGFLKPTTNLTLGTNRNAVAGYGEGLHIGNNSVISMQPGSDVSLFATRNLFLNGEITTRGGDVNLSLKSTGSGQGIANYEPNAAIWLGDNADINTQGVFVADAANDLGRRTGTLLDAGNVNIAADRGYIITAKNSRINIAGRSDTADLPSVLSGNAVVEYQRQKIKSTAGDISFTAAEGMFIQGALDLSAANIEGAAGGKISLELNPANRVGLVGGSVNNTANAREIHLVQNQSDLPSNFLTGQQQQGDAVDSRHIGKAWISSQLIRDSGAARLKLDVRNMPTVNNASGTGMVVFEDNINLQLAQSIEIIAPQIKANSKAGGNTAGVAMGPVNISAPYILLGSVLGQQPDSTISASSGNSILNISAGLNGNSGLLELMGNVSLQGINAVNLSSEGDIRFRGVQKLASDKELTGSLDSWGSLSLQANQVYGTTLSRFDLSVSGDLNGVLSIKPNDIKPNDIKHINAPLLSAGSELSLTAPVIRQSGVLKAPLGKINLNASQQLRLEDGSLTSVSAEGAIIPFGSTLGEERWIYPFDTATTSGAGSGATSTGLNFASITQPPVKEINTQSPDIQVADNAVIDISGGGDLYSWEFVPGIGGSVDTLLSGNSNGAFSVIPGRGVGSDAFAPYDFQYSSGDKLQMGSQIYLSATDNLPAGLYTLLPARYALLPGAFLITPTGAGLLQSQQFTRLDGTQITAGQARFAGTDLHDNLWRGYTVENGDAVRLRSEYVESYASQFFRDDAIRNDRLLPLLPEDAGTLNITAGNNLQLSGVLKGQAAQIKVIENFKLKTVTGRGSQVNIAGNELRVVADYDSNGGIQLLDDNLNNFNADSLMLGGIRQRNSEAVDVVVSANSVTIESASHLAVDDIYLVSNDLIDIKSGATVTARSSVSAVALNPADRQIRLQGDGALIRVSANQQIQINRSNESLNPVQGKVNIERGARLEAGQSMAIDSSTDTQVAGDLVLNGGSLNLGASKISIGQNASGTANSQLSGLSFTSRDLQQMNAGELVLTSRSSVDLYGNINLSLNNLVIEAAAMNGFQQAAEQVNISADKISLGNPSNRAVSGGSANSSGAGNLVLQANNINLFDGDFTLNGFNNINFQAQQNIVFNGKGMLNAKLSGDLVLDARRVTASSRADHGLNAAAASLVIKDSFTGVLTGSLAGALTDTAVGDTSLGANLKFSAADILHQGNIKLASGVLGLTASSGELQLDNASSIDLSGLVRDFAGEKVYTPGGTLSLKSARMSAGTPTRQASAGQPSLGGAGNGNGITMLSAAIIDVSAGVDSQNGGDAGAIKVDAQGSSVVLDGQLIANHGSQARGGRFSLDTVAIANTAGRDLALLNSTLNDNGFSAQRKIRMRQGDINIQAGETIKARDVLLQADNGSITVAGSIDAQQDVFQVNTPGNTPGKIHLAALNNVSLGSTALLDASTGLADQRGGNVMIETANGFLDLQAGSVINVSGGAGSQSIGQNNGQRNGQNNNNRGGKIHLRMPRNASNDAVNITSIASNLQGFRRLNIEGFKQYTTTSGLLSRADFTTPLAEASRFSSNTISGNGIVTGLDFSVDTANVHLTPGIEFVAAGDLTLTSAMDLANNRFSNEGGVLTLKAAGNLNLNNSIQDGFKPVQGASRLQQGESWSYNLFAGADLSAAANDSILAGTGNLTLASNKIIRTGKGDINVSAGNNITLATDASIYTAGESTGRGSYENVAGFGNALDAFLLPQVEFPDQGGDINIIAGGNIQGNQKSVLVTDWLYRLGDRYNFSGKPDSIGTTWGIAFNQFKHGVGALGGGNVSVQAGGDLTGLSVSSPTTGKQLAALNLNADGASFSTTQNIIEVQGGGDITLNVSGDIRQLVLFAANGAINVDAGGDIGDQQIQNGLALITADTQSRINAAGDIHFLGANNFSLLPISKNQQAANQGIFALTSYENYFSTYTESNSITLSALSGDIEIINPQASALTGIYNNRFANAGLNAQNRLFGNYPGSLKVTAIDGDITLKNSLILWPADNGNLSLLAQNNIIGDNPFLTVSMLDVDPSDIPGVFNTRSQFSIAAFPVSGAYHGKKLLHQNDSQAARVVANTGDIRIADAGDKFRFETSKRTEVFAGNDIRDVSFAIQQVNKNDISIIQSGRDIDYINSLAETGSKFADEKIAVSGPGQLQVLAGRNIDLGDQLGIVANGNNENANLLNESAKLIVMAGLGSQGADYGAFINRYFTAGSSYSAGLINFITGLNNAVSTALTPGLSFANALQQFKQLDEKQQRLFVLQAFNNEYTESAKRAAQEQFAQLADNDTDRFGYSRGLDAIETLFPGSVISKRAATAGETTAGDRIVTGGFSYLIPDVNAAYSGNISMVASTIQAQDNKGDIMLYAPGGFLNVGLSVSGGTDTVEKGIITKGDGSINAFTQGNVSVNQSRIQALNGGAISIWSSKGDIDAGRGAKSALTIPPPRLVTDSRTGSVVQVFDAVVQGNGIQTACFDESCEGGATILAAPAGVINAGDAGIRSSGNLFLATNTVLNANQIQAGGEVSGDLGGSVALGADLGSLNINSSVDDSATELVAQNASDQFGPGSVAILQVEVMGLSGEPASVSGENSKNKDQKIEKD